MTKIESHPTKRKPWEYLFFIDFEGDISNKKIIKALKVVEKNSTFLKILGSYPSASL